MEEVTLVVLVLLVKGTGTVKVIGLTFDLFSCCILFLLDISYKRRRIFLFATCSCSFANSDLVTTPGRETGGLQLDERLETET